MSTAETDRWVEVPRTLNIARLGTNAERRHPVLAFMVSRTHRKTSPGTYSPHGFNDPGYSPPSLCNTSLQQTLSAFLSGVTATTAHAETVIICPVAIAQHRTDSKITRVHLSVCLSSRLSLVRSHFFARWNFALSFKALNEFIRCQNPVTHFVPSSDLEGVPKSQSLRTLFLTSSCTCYQMF